jgi:hypothetical protein
MNTKRKVPRLTDEQKEMRRVFRAKKKEEKVEKQKSS